MKVKHLLKKTLVGFLILLSLLIIYVVVGVTVPYIPVNSDFEEPKEGVDIYLLTNGVHTDIVVPLQNPYKDWSKQLKPESTRSKDTEVKYAAFGWGDKGFYIDTPTWAELKFTTAFKAMFYMSTSAMHVTFYRNMEVSDRCRKVRIGTDNYKKLIKYIELSFDKNKAGDYIQINHSYGENDLFFEAVGSYSLFNTCNTWANEGLKCGNLKACLWTPLDKGIFYHYKQVGAK